MIRAVLIMSVTALASACDVGEVDIGGGGGTTDAPMASAAKTTAFNNNVKPIIMAKGCVAGAGGACHAVQAPILDTSVGMPTRYTAGPSAQNILITKDAATPGMHSGFPYFSTADKTTVAAWIDMP